MNESQETIKKVAEEGLEARNLVNWIAESSLNDIKTTSKPPTSPKPKAADSTKNIDPQILLKTKRRGALSRPKCRLRSASAGRNPEKDLRARYWTFLFENLHRAVDEIYQTCEMDESIVESKEAIMMLENYSKDFNSLIQYINISKNYEKTAPVNRPTSLAWEVRKSSPGKSLLKNAFIEKLTAGNSQAKRVLCFDSSSNPQNILENEIVPSKVESNPVVLNFNPKDKTPEEPEVEIITNSLGNKKCGITISVVPEGNEGFLCNDGLIVREASEEIFAEKPSVDVKVKTESPNSDPVICNDKSGNSGPDLCSNKNANSDPVLCNNKNDNSASGCTEKSENKLGSNNENCFVVNSKEILPVKKKAFSETVNCSVSVSSVLSSDKSASIHSVCTENNEVRLDKPAANIKEKEKLNVINFVEPLAEKNFSSEAVKFNTELKENKLKSETKESDNKMVSKQDISLSASEDKKRMTVKRKVLVKKSAKISNEIASSVPNSNKLSSSIEEKSNLKHNLKLSNTNTGPVKDKTMCKSSSKEPEQTKKNSDNSVRSANSSAKITPKPVADKHFVASSKSTNSKPVPLLRKTDATDEKKTAKTYSRPSAIQRNISYVSTLSSKNQLEKAASEEKTKTIRTVSHAMKLPVKSGSMSSLHKISTAQRWSNKASSVEQIPEVGKSNTDEDSDGWETVRGRNRCRNSPAKKIVFSSEKNSKALDIAKFNQSKFGGFPYTTKGNNSKVTPSKVTPKKDDKNSKEEKSSASTKPNDSSREQVQSVSKKISSNKLSSNEESKMKLDETVVESSSKNDSVPRSAFISELMSELMLPDCLCYKIKSLSFKSHRRCRSSSVPCFLRESNRITFDLNKVKSLSEQSLMNRKYCKIKHSSRNSVERNLNFTRKKSKKSQGNRDSDNGHNTSLEESDPGLTSDDQDGQTSHDEAYDAHCQDLCDTAWKYKILEQQVHKLELSWGEQMDRFDLELRTPGRALEMHEKLSSPFRKKSPMESIRLHEEKQVKAREQRERLLEEKRQKLKEIEKKRLEMKALTEQRQEKQRIVMEQKLQRAEEKRKKQLQMIIKKAHDEEEKVNEIAFINTLEAQNKRHDLLSKEKDHEARLHDIQEERQRKQEEKAAKEAAAEERRKLLEAERLARLNEMQEKRKMRDHKVEQLFLVKEKERQELANQKARDREQRLSALNAQQQNTIEELQKKIQLKQEESARRHEENMEQIRQKAFELSVRRCSSNNDDAPQPVPYETKKICTMCNVLIGSEVYLLSHLRGKKHQETVKDQYQGKDLSVEELELYNLKHIVDASTDQLDPNIALDKERQKALKKRCKRLRQRMSNRGQEYESQLEKSVDSVHSNMKAKVVKMTADIKKLISSYEKSGSDNKLLSSLERYLNEIENTLGKKLHQDKTSFRMVGGLSAFIDIFKWIVCLPIEKSAFLHKKIINHLSNTAESIVENCYENCLYILFSNKIGCLLDLLIQRLNVLIPNNCNQIIVAYSKSPGLNIRVDLNAGKLMHFLSSILSTLAGKQNNLLSNVQDNADQKENQSDEFHFRVQDVISYTVSIGIIDKLSQYFNSIQGPVSNEVEVADFLLDCISFLTSLIKLYSDCFNSKTDDATQLIAAIKVTNMVGCVSLLYGLLLHSGVSSRGDTLPPQLPKQIESLVASTLCMLNNMAVMNLQAFQTVLGSEGVSLQLRHITSHLLWYCSHWTSDQLLHEVILLVGYFTVLNTDNQSLIQAGQRPTVLQQLCSLPFLYFCDSELTDILFPTLISCCYNNSSNKTILEQEMSSELLSNYIEIKYMNSEECPSKPKKALPEKRWLFSTRFPKSCWSSGKYYFGPVKKEEECGKCDS